MSEKKIFNTDEAAKILGIAPITLHVARRKGLIRCYKLGHKTVRFDMEQINEYLTNPFTVKGEAKSE